MCASRIDALHDALRSRVLVLAGSLGVSLRKLCPSVATTDTLNLTKPELVAQTHRSFLDAGADIIETNTFNSQAFTSGRYTDTALVWHLNIEGARIACRVADEIASQNPSKPRFVAGVIGPTVCALSHHPEAFDSMRTAFAWQARALIEGGADFLLVETIYDRINAEAALAGIADAGRDMGVEISVALSATSVDNSQDQIFDSDFVSHLQSMNRIRLIALSYNCADGSSSLADSVLRLNAVSPYPTLLYPNAGLPDANGQYPISPEAFVAALRPLLVARQLNVVGGCCGTTPAHIAALSEEVKAYLPRELC